MSKPPRIPDSDNAIGQLVTELGSASSLKGLHPIDDGPIPPAEAGDPNIVKSLHADASDSPDAAPTAVTGGGLKLIGLAEASSRLGIHLDGSVLDTATTNASGFWNHAATGYADSSVTYTASTTDATAGTSTTSTGATVTTASLFAAPSNAIDPIFETRVAAAGDDVEEKGSGTISGNINDLELGYDGTTRQTVGIRFTSIDIPKGAIITSAYIQFQANEVMTGAASLLIQGDNTDDANPFTTASFNVSSLPRTTASTAWTPDPWTVVGEHGLAEQTPDLTAIVQEIVNRSGWAALNDMAFLVTGTGTRTADSYEYNPASAPLLHVEYLLPGPVGNPVAFNAPPDADPTANQIAELAVVGAAVGITASATDPDAGSTVTYSLNDSRFAIDASSGIITRSATGTLDFETQTSINLTVTATSSDGSTANQSFTVGVLDSPEPVAFNTTPDADTAVNQIAQSAAAGTAAGITASATDPDAGSTITYTIDDTRFSINASTGVITRSSTGTLNATSEPSVSLTVTATSSDGSTDSHAFSVAVLGSPVAFNTPSDADPTVNQIAELAAVGASTGITASATDPDAGSTVTYSLNDARFAIDAISGIITRSGTGTLDFETQSSINLNVTATSSDGSTANQAFTLAVLNSPEPVAFNASPDANPAVNQITQNAAAGTAIGITAAATDPDAGATITYSISDSRFAINASTGVITRSGTGTLNATSEPSVNFNVTATSSDGSTDTHAFAVSVTGGTTPVIFEARVATAGDDVEQKGSGAISTNVTDLELGYDGSTSQTVGMHFTGINIPQGAIITGAYIQFQANEVKTGATSLLIQGDNVDDASPFTSVKFNVSSLPRTAASAAWTPDPWTVVGEHGAAERTPDLTAIVQEIVNRSGWAALNDMAFLVTGTGTRTADSYEYNPASAPLLHIEYVLPGPAGSPVAFNSPPDADSTTNQIAELATAGTAVGITASATDPDAGSTVAYTIDDSRFAIDASSGIITRSATGALDFETQTSINLTVTATSSDGSTANQTFTLGVLDSPEPVAFKTPSDADSAVNRIAQNGVAGTAIGITASAGDPDAGSTVTYSINDSRFAINASTGVITRSGTGTLNATSEPSINLHVTATSSDGSTAGQDYAVSVTTGPIFETRIASSADDVEQGPSGGMDLVSGNLDMVYDGTKVQTVGMRFTSVDIPYDAVITSAYIQFQAQNTSTGAVSLLIRGENNDESQPFEIETSDVTSRPMTNASVTWTPPDWTANNEAGLAERTADISAIVQEIIGRSGWLTLNDMAFVVSGTSGERRANSFDGSSTGAPLLHIEYYVPTTGPVSFKHPADADSATNQIVQNAAAGTAIGITASAKDPDVTNTVTYSLNDSRFAIDVNTGVITRSGTGTLNAATEPSINLHVTATSSDGSTAAHDYAVSIVPTTAPQTLYRFAIFGDYGDTDLTGEKAISAMVHAWNADFVLTVGDNAYAPQTFDPAVGQQYHDYIGNYQGAYGSGSTINRFFPTLGNHEYNEGTVPAYLNYFTLPDNERYYDFQIGPVHFFALNSNKQEPDGRSSTSVQGHWMQNLLANSDASFNLAYFHHTPYNPSGSTLTMRWPFEQWGVNAVFAGHEHNYYRENRDDNGDGVFLPYTTTGLGGTGKTVPNVGANLVTVTDAGMLIEFYKVSSFDGTTATPVLTDSYFVPTPAGRTPTIVNGGYVLNGTTGADYLWGLGGNDTLNGGRGNDTLVAGNQHNLFVFAVGDGQDTILNFLPGAGTGDVLDLRAFGINNASQFQQVATNQGSNVVASLGGGDQITLIGVHEEQFHNDNFLSSLLLA